jgi:hypothetical protein
MSALPRVLLTFKEVPINILMSYLMELDELLLKLTWKKRHTKKGRKTQKKKRPWWHGASPDIPTTRVTS